MNRRPPIAAQSSTQFVDELSMTPSRPATELALGVELPVRQAKPRTRGLTMIIDWGLPCGLQADVVATAGSLIDMAKIAGSI